MNDDFEDRLSQISAKIDQLRASTGKDRRELLDTLFRNVHSLKAAAHANGLNDLAARAHEFEDLLHAVRTGKASLDEVPDFEHPQHPQVENVIPAEIRDSLKDEERHRLAQCMAEGANVYLVDTNFALPDFDRQFQQMKEDLNHIGEVIATAPKVEGDKINFRILYATQSDLYRICHQAMQAGRAVKTGKDVDFSIRVDGALDKSVCDALADPLMHLVRNAVDHGIETKGHVAIEATEKRITVTDDGRGIDAANMDRIFEPGFSTAAEITPISGRGVGLDVVRTAVEQLGGTLNVSSDLGKGTTFEIILK
ncbi:MAG TPA: ATP-binding protein [Pyrinomonadaceae bacterium]|nr:ATP-binding protein [Pyrinomonadaceae bacterium]